MTMVCPAESGGRSRTGLRKALHRKRKSAYRWTILRARPSPPSAIHNTEPITVDDVIIIGGSFAGLAAALQLGRARRKVTVLDTGLPRNRFAGHSHGLLGHDHKPPLDILAEARQQL